MSSTALPPGPKGTWIGGNLRQFTQGRLDFFRQLAHDYGDVASIRFGTRRIFLISNPDLIEEVLVTQAKHYIKHFGARSYKPVLGNGLVTSEGELWLRQRRLSQPAFLKQRVQSYAPIMSDLTEAMLAKWKPGAEVDIHAEFTSLTSAIALKTLFGLDDPGDRARFTEPLRIAFDLMSIRIRTLLKPPRWLPVGSNRKLNHAVKELFSVVDGYIEAGRLRGHSGDDLLSRLVSAQDEDGTRMSHKQLRDELMTLYLAGHETTSLTLSWSWYLISQHPEVERKLVEEWQRVLGGRPPTPEDLSSMPYTDAVITEAMRVYPPVYLIGREATRDMDLGGYRVRKGYTVFISQWVNHRDARWFSNPDQFQPERWEDGLAKRIPKYAYFPFGGGPRICIGNTFAMMEAAILLATVGQKYHFTLLPNARIDVNPQITLAPKYGIPAQLKRRS
ncbi:cytochrome P450 [Schlesneria sp. T3-172]|uniref:cytochrome P450 n=1 Tax=Schlesneria sphaerica TaxID=3373610 RepID=UPI0037CA9D85